METCGLKDMGCFGHKFTWSNKREDNFIEERLDRAIASEEWLDLFPSFSVHNIVWDSSNNLPILVKASKNIGGLDSGAYCDDRPFKVETKWFHVEEFREVVERAWVLADRNSLGSWSDKISQCGRILDKWGKHTFKNIHKRLRCYLRD